MAAGKGSRIKSVFNESEPIKPLIRYNGKRLIEYVMDSISGLSFDNFLLLPLIIFNKSFIDRSLTFQY